MFRMRIPCAATLCVVSACASEPALDPAAVIRESATHVDVVQDVGGAVDWHRTASASSPRLARRRAELAAAQARIGAAGASSIMLDAEGFDGDDGAVGQVGLLFDPIAIAGFGKVALRRCIAEQQALLARARLAREEASVREDVDSALGRVTAMATACAELEDLRLASLAGFERIRTIVAAGGLGANSADGVAAAQTRLDAVCAEALAGEANARTDLASACGLSADAVAVTEAFDVDAPARMDALDASLPQWASIDLVLAAHPDLDEPRLELAVAEAEFRLALRARWPDLRLGPAVSLMPDAALPGGLLTVDLPQPIAAHHEVSAAAHRRDAAVATLRQAAQARLADVRVVERERTAARTAKRAAEAAANAAIVELRAATTRFANDRRAYAEWLLAVERRSDAIAELGDARARTARAVTRARRLLDAAPESTTGATP